MDLAVNDIILLKAINITGFVCSYNKVVYFHKQLDKGIECSLDADFAKKSFIIIRDYHINSIIDLNGIIKYKHNPSDAL